MPSLISRVPRVVEVYAKHATVKRTQRSLNSVVILNYINYHALGFRLMNYITTYPRNPIFIYFDPCTTQALRSWFSARFVPKLGAHDS